MSARTLQSNAFGGAYEDFESGRSYTNHEFFSGEPICERRGRRTGASILKAIIFVAVLSGGGWVYLHHRAAFDHVLTAVSEVITAAIERNNQKPEATAPITAPPAPQMLQAHDVADAPGADAGTAAPEAAAPAQQNENVPSDEAKADDAPSAPLPPPAFDKADPLKAKAVAAGLHPDLSQALLKKMTVADFRNAAHAIQTALTGTPDGDVFTWPPEVKPQLAQFEVKFVRGADHCRRYVVIISKDRWSTTAQAMEKCGITAPAVRNAKAAAG